MAWLNSVLLIGLAVVSLTASSHDEGCSVFLSLKGQSIANNSYVAIDDIGEYNDALLCHTDKIDCCRYPYSYHGQWYYPSGIQVDIYIDYAVYDEFYRNRGTRIVRLNHRQGRFTERGLFRCEVPDASNINQRIYVNIVHIENLTVSPIDPATKFAGEIFSLVCSADIHPLPTSTHGELSMFEWLFDNSSLPSGATVSNVTKSGNTTYTSILQFSPLHETYTGVYTCRIGSRAVSTTITVVDSVITIFDSGTQKAGEIYTLTCVVNGIENAPSLTVIYRWTKNNGSTQVEVGNSSTLIFSPLKLSDDGQYICQVTISSRMYGAIEYINVQIPPPSMHIVSNQTNPIRPIGSAVSLTCMVELSPAVDVPVIINIHLSDPDESPLTTTTPSVSGSTYTTTATINSFGREQSGEYTCTVSIGSSRSWSTTKKVTVGVYLLLKGTLYTNNSDIFINEIGETDHISLVPTQNNALQCITDRSPCCRSFPWVGEWYFPNGTVIPGPIDHDQVFYRNRGPDDGIVNLNYINSTLPALSPTGLFCCVLPDMDNENQRLCANLDIVIVTITRSGNNTAGEIYNLECSVNGHSAIFQWSDESGDLIIGNNQGPRTITTSSVTSRIQFSPLHESHGGKYTCSVNVGRVTKSKSTSLSVRVPNVAVKMKHHGNVSIGGQGFSLSCVVSGAENLSPTITYNWIKDNGTRILVDSHGSILSFPFMRLSDAGQYSCQVIVDSPYLRDNLDVTSTTFAIHLQVPQPVVKLVSDTPNPVLSGSSPTLTCAVELSPAVDVPVTISTVWTGPDGSILTSGAPPVMRSFTHYTSDLKLNYVESADSGNYNCTVSIGGKIRTSVQRKIVIGEGMFQLRLMYTDDCRLWYKSRNSEFELYKYHIEEALTEAIESRCKCYFPRANLLKASFSCGSSPNLTTYRNTLIGTHNFNATQLIGFIQDWVTSEPIINIKDYAVWLDSTCPVAIASLKEPECGEVRHCPCTNDPNVSKCVKNLENDNFAGCIDSCIIRSSM